jgi:hypothetical protein
MAMSDRNKSDDFETKLQPDPMLRTGPANRVWVWTVAGAVAIILIVTLVGVISKNRVVSQNQTSAKITERAN